MEILFQKALLLLDRNKTEEAKNLLLEIFTQANTEERVLYILKSSVVLGEIYFLENDKEKAKEYLKIVINTQDDDWEDVLDWEKNRAIEILEIIEKGTK